MIILLWVRYALGRKDSNLRIAGPKPVALPLGHAPFRFAANKD